MCADQREARSRGNGPLAGSVGLAWGHPEALGFGGDSECRLKIHGLFAWFSHRLNFQYGSEVVESYLTTGILIPVSTILLTKKNGEKL